MKYNNPREIEVDVSITLSKTVKVIVDDYVSLGTTIDEDGIIMEDVDYSSCDLKQAVKEQLYLPNEAGNLIKENTTILSTTRLNKAKEDLSGWCIDDFEVCKSL